MDITSAISEMSGFFTLFSPLSRHIRFTVLS
nr:MAG TPA: hypothetical protein [Caudoviricetes sp.]